MFNPLDILVFRARKYVCMCIDLRLYFYISSYWCLKFQSNTTGFTFVFYFSYIYEKPFSDSEKLILVILNILTYLISPCILISSGITPFHAWILYHTWFLYLLSHSFLTWMLSSKNGGNRVVGLLTWWLKIILWYAKFFYLPDISLQDCGFVVF